MRPVVIFIALVTIASASYAQSYLNFPDINGDTIVFTCEGDLWTVPATGGVATRLTTAEGLEYMAKFSPDGKYVAFTGEYDKGGNDVYVIPASGGEVKRLTYHPWSDYVLTWSVDGDSVIFRSMRSSAHYIYKVFAVSRDGGFPRELNLGEVSLISFAPDGRHVAFNRYSREFRTWKRYKGGLAQDVWVGDLKELEFKKLTDYEGTDAFPMWYEGRIYFISDRTGRMNIFSMKPDGSDLKQHTFHENYDVRWPSLGDGRIVYHHAGDIWLFDIATGDYHRVAITVPSDRQEERERFVDPIKYLTDYEISPKGRRVAFCARGEVALLPAKEGRLIYLTTTPGIREKFPRWAPDGKSVLYVSDATGEDEIYVVDIFSKQPEQITKGTQGWKYPPVWSPDGKKIAYSDGSQTIYIADRESGKITRADSSDYWEIKRYSWSPDSRYLAYDKPENHHFNSIFIYDTMTGRVHRVTDDFTHDTNPVWDPEGKYLYFLSDRTINPLLGKIAFTAIIDRTTKPYMVLLQKGMKSPFFPREPEEMESEESNGEEEKQVEVKIDFDGLTERIVEFPVEAGHYDMLAAGKGKVYYRSRPSVGMKEGQRRGKERKPIHSVHVFDLEEEKDEVILSGINSYHLSADGKKILYRKMDTFYVVDAGQKVGEDTEKDEVDLSRWHIRLKPREEWRQIFDEAWRLQRDFYWAPDMAKMDWAGVKAKYEKLFPKIATRYELHDLIGEMIGELSTSHTYIWGGDLRRPEPTPVGLLGAKILADKATGLYRIVKIYPQEPSAPDAYSPLTLSHADVREGDYILAVNRKPLDTSINFYSAFLNLADEEVLLTVNDEPTMSGARDVVVKTIENDFDLRYLDWVSENRKFVEEASGGKIGYIHLPDMSTRGLVEFQRTFYPQIEKPALIIDVRYNGGGFVSELILERISIEVLAYGKARKGKPYRYPEEGLRAHLVALCDAHAGSDGDIFTRAFKLANLGTVIGTRTWGGVVGIRMDKPFVDGGMMTIPEFAWWEAEGGWTLENWGAVPDIEVDNLPGDVIRGHDTQLEKAVAILNSRLEKEPLEEPPLPPYPHH